MNIGFFKFQPYFKSVLWGGEKIAQYKGISTDQKQIGESWEISGIQGRESVVSEGDDSGLTIIELIRKYKGDLVGKKFYITHGYLENVKFGDDRLVYKGQSLDADIILYGHTHVPVNKRVDGIYVFNPGSIRDGNYGFIDITEKGEVICVNAKI